MRVSDRIRQYPERPRAVSAMSRLRVTNRRTGNLLGAEVRRADSIGSRLIGLLGRSSLAPGEGLWIEPCSSIHMFFMRFAIDAVFLDRDHAVTRAAIDVRPWRLAFGGSGARSVLELPVGTITASGTRDGDALEITRADA